jgi:hypothetical protein
VEGIDFLGDFRKGGKCLFCEKWAFVASSILLIVFDDVRI